MSLPDFYGSLDGEGIAHKPGCYWERVVIDPRKVQQLPNGSFATTCDVCSSRVLWEERDGDRVRLPDPEEDARQRMWHPQEGTALAPTIPHDVRPATRRRGRPAGSRTHTTAAIVETFRRLHTSYGRRPEQDELAANLEPRIEVRTLQDHLTAYRLPWPIE